MSAGFLAAPEAPAVDWPGYLSWMAVLALLLVLVYWLMRQGWRRRGLLQSGLPALPAAPDPDPDPAAGLPDGGTLRLAGRYHGTTTAGQWLDRIVAHGLGVRSRAELTLTRDGVRVERSGAPDFFIPAGRLRGARLDKAIAGKVLTDNALLVIVWEHGGRLLDSGFRSDRAAEHPAWVDALSALAGRAAGTAPGGHPAPAAAGGAGGTGSAEQQHQEGTP
ncbi:hypothetical protein [Streptomyces aidingensis]|uniref:PH domain-containing protein n=1 Tax=Streptomyces aidingensis TaxID=910347 RepID=A0A1I1P8A2_9ACTN|nr:hypothetical protein [Streptomyces aidingensis]SFD05832.1 hypothetical protein SAMN05421773_10922 [Streptomyces aidingensis]